MRLPKTSGGFIASEFPIPKMKIAVLGGGLIGSAIVEDLSHDFDVTCVDISDENLSRLSTSHRVKTLKADLSSADEVKEVAACFDLIVGAVPGFMGFKTLQAIKIGRAHV